MKNPGLAITLCLFLAAPSWAATTQTITLKDGSKINGTVVGMSNGRYMVNSSAFGQIAVQEDNIVSIMSPQAAAQAAAPQTGAPQNNATAYAGQIQAVQAQIASNPALIADIQAMAQDPDFLAAMQDPAFMSAVQSGNVQALQGSPQIQRLLNNPRMQSFIEKIRPQGQQ